ncbi:MAG: MMPL family transporter [Planctomycetota bacterium]
MRDRLLGAAADLAWRRSGLVLAVALVLAGLGIALAATRLRLNANTDDLISPDRPYMQNYRRFIEECGDLEFIYLVVEHHDDPAAAKACIDDLAASLAARPELELPVVHARIEPDEQLALATHAMSDEEFTDLSLPAEAYGALWNGGGTGGLIQEARQGINRLLATGAFVSEARAKEIGAGALFLCQLLAAAGGDEAAGKALGGLGTRPEPEYLVSSTGKLYFLKILPVKDYGTLAVIERPLAVIREVMADVRGRHPAVEIGLTGKPVLQADEMATTDRDMTRSTSVAIALVALLFMLVLGGVRRPLLAVATLLVGIAWTFGLTTVAIGQLNLLSVVFTLVLVGIGIDFGVHVVMRYREARRSAAPREALRTAVLTAGRGNVTGALTSSIAFLMAILTGFRGLEELGFIAGAGLLLCLVAMTIVLPALLAMTERRQSGLEPGRPIAEEGRGPGGRLAPLAALVLTLALAPFAGRVAFDENILDLQAKGLDSVEWEHRIIEDSGAETWFGVVARDDLEAVAETVERARREPAIASVRSALDLVRPDSPERRAARARLDSVFDVSLTEIPVAWAPIDLDGLGRSLMALARRAREEAPDEAREMAGLARALVDLAARLEGEDRVAVGERLETRIAEVAAALSRMFEGMFLPLREVLPAAIRDLFASPTGRLLVTMHPRGNVWDDATMTSFVAAMRRVDPQVTGVPITHHESIRDMRGGFGRAALLALAAVVLLVALDFRRPLPALLALVPLFAGGIWLVGLMGLTGLHFNLANFFAVPILIGIGVDNGIHLVHRWRESRDEEGPLRLGATKRGVLLTSLTTAIGFGCLAFASHRGLQSLGFVMALGSLAILAASLLVLPALLARLRPR